MEKVNGSNPYDDAPPTLTEEDWERLFETIDAEHRLEKPFINVLIIADTEHDVPMITKALSHLVIKVRGNWYRVIKDKRTPFTGQEYHMDTLTMFLRKLEAYYGKNNGENP